LDELWRHSLQTASLARRLASADRQTFRECQTAYVAGLLHDVGKFILAAHNNGTAQTGAEGDHSAIGAYLLGVWGLPEPIVSTAELHHSLHAVPPHAYFPILYVHVAQSLGLPGRADELDEEFVARAGKADRIPMWREVLDKHS
jgi:putative nucleotidyltransferase with HDIG domain